VNSFNSNEYKKGLSKGNNNNKKGTNLLMVNKKGFDDPYQCNLYDDLNEVEIMNKNRFQAIVTTVMRKFCT